MDDEMLVWPLYRRPRGYRAPESAPEVLRRHRAGERYFALSRLDGQDLGGACLDGSNFLQASLRQLRAQRASLRVCDLSLTNLSDAALDGACLSGVWGSLSVARHVRLQGADLSRSIWTEADLRDADLRGARLDGARLRGADLRGADLREASLRDVDLWGVQLEGALLLHARASVGTHWPMGFDPRREGVVLVEELSPQDFP